MYVKHADNIKMKNIAFSLEDKDYISALIFVDMKD
tara:strand:+ start:935 stop:1039 length:105 start_codon:yes stop_codon:yes gene_type:complete